jgi:hypothetical protein
MRPAGQALLLVVLEDRVPRCREDPEHEQSGHHGRDAERGQVDPARSGEEEHAGERGRVDHRRPEVGLQEDEEDRTGGEADRGQDRAAVVHPLRAVGEQPRKEENEQQLPELRRLELEEA